MNKAVPWNVKGVGFDAREAARIAARRAGLPVGQWLNSVIAERAAELGIDTDDIEPGDRLEAIAARLSSVGSPAQATALDAMRAATARQSAETAPPSFAAIDGDRTRHRETERQWHADAERDSEPIDADGEVLLRTAPPSVYDQRKAATRSMPTTAAPWTTQDPRHDRIPPRTLHETSMSFAAGENGRGPLPPQSPSEIERLDTKLASILQKLNRSFEPVGVNLGGSGQDRGPASGVARARRNGADDPARPSGQGRFGDAVAEIARRQSMLNAAEPIVGRREGDAARGRGTDSGPRRLEPADDRRNAPTGTSTAELHTAFDALAEQLEARLAEAAAGAMLPLSPARAKAEKAPATSPQDPRIEAPARDVTNAKQVSRNNAELRRLRREIASLSTSLADFTPQHTLSGLEEAVRELIGRVDLSKLDGVQASVLAPVERLGSELRDAIRAMDPQKPLHGLRLELETLGTKVDTIQAQSVSPDLIARLFAETRDIRDFLAQASVQGPATEGLHRELTRLGARVDQLVERPVPTASRDLANAVGDIRAMLKRFEPDGLFQNLDRKIDLLSAKIDSGLNRQPPIELFEDLARQIDRAHDSLSARLADRGPAPQFDLAPIEQMITQLSGKLDGLGRASADVDALYKLIGGLVDRIEDARQPQADTTVLNALETQLGRLAERLDRSDVNQTAISALEQSIGDLFLQIEESRNAAIDAAENAARTAAQDTLRAAMDNPALNGSELTVQTGLDVEQVSHELSGIRRAQEASEKRVNATLAALNTTLERLVDRMVSERPAATVKLEATPSHSSGAKAGRIDHRFDPDAFLLEPGTKPARIKLEPQNEAAPGVEIDRGRSEEPTSDVAPLIAAARRAAQAAQASALSAARDSGLTGEAGILPDPPASGLSRAQAFIARKRRPLLLGLAGIVLLLGALQIVRLSSGRQPATTPAAIEPATPQPSPKPETRSDAAPAQPVAVAAAPKVDTSLLQPPDAKTVDQATSFTPAAPAKPAAPVMADAAPTGIGAGLRDLAANGDANAQFEVGVRLAEGRGVPRDLKLAVRWFERAAKQGLAPAEYRLGSLYEKGLGVTADPNLAVAWYERAAGLGNIRAMHNLAVMAAEGAGSKPDYTKAATWFTKAANFGVRDSQFNLAILYARGLGVPQSLPQSYVWFAIAAAQGDADAGRKRDEVAAKLDAGALAGAKKTVGDFHPIAAAQVANDVTAPPGGWDALAPANSTSGLDKKAPDIQASRL